MTTPLLMDLRALLPVFATVFLAELGDKTQLATLLFAANPRYNGWLIFLAASLALVCSAALAVVAGNTLARYVDTRLLTLVAGVGFIVIGVWTLVSALRA